MSVICPFFTIISRISEQTTTNQAWMRGAHLSSNFSKSMTSFIDAPLENWRKTSWILRFISLWIQGIFRLVVFNLCSSSEKRLRQTLYLPSRSNNSNQSNLAPYKAMFEVLSKSISIHFVFSIGLGFFSCWMDKNLTG